MSEHETLTGADDESEEAPVGDTAILATDSDELDDEELAERAKDIVTDDPGDE